MRQLFRFVAVLALLTSLSGCDSAAAAGTQAVGAWGDTESAGQPSLVFDSDGSVSGSDGCNRLMGRWTAHGDTVSLGRLASTMMACEGVYTWLNAAASGRIDGEKLHIFDASGAEIGRLERG
ncbi:META domain-containing protein [Saxibacter everestensis]|uniref:META domain-containing protein n=1 Tax=Saxibacter everestensis TaxID=2909229 RepID=A0ABY8QT86_9MICO|nr:META domain-containing protein [Brevibacteriaceae bacterium ZFBP1038]